MMDSVNPCDSNIKITITVPVIVSLLVLFMFVYLVDINYYLRSFLIFIHAFLFRKKLEFLDSSVVYGTVLPSDSDLQITHMNNARVLREYDFGRMDFWARTGLLNDFIKDTLSLKPHPILAVANVIRYRRPLHMFMKYKIVTRAMHWDGKMLYLEQRMITLNDEITRNIGYLKVIFPYDIDDFVKKNHPGVVKPELPKDLELWMRFNEANGLKTKCQNQMSKSCDGGS